MAEKQYADLCKKRSSIKGQATKNAKIIQELKAKPVEEITRKDCLNLETRIKALEGLRTQFNETQDLINSLLVKDADIDAQDEQRATDNETILNNITEMNYLIDQYNTLHARAVTPAANFDMQSIQDVLHNHVQQREREIKSEIKLPTIKIPEFDGSYDKWIEFNDIFSALVHNNNNLTNIQKFYYLKSAVCREAASIIQSVEISDNNYAVAWELLQTRFKNTALIVNNYVKALIESPQIAKESAVNLRTFLDSVNKNIRCLEALKQPVTQWDTLLVYIVVSKFDLITRREWEQERSGKAELATYKDVQEFLEKKCIALENMHFTKTHQTSTNNQNFNSNTNKVNASNSRSAYSAQSMYYNKRSTNLLATNSCKVCGNSDHPIFFCNTFKSFPIQRRINAVKTARLCYNCLRSNHQTKDCTASRCRTCNGMHNTLLHLDRNQNQAINNNENLNANFKQNHQISNQSINHNNQASNSNQSNSFIPYHIENTQYKSQSNDISNQVHTQQNDPNLVTNSHINNREQQNANQQIYSTFTQYSMQANQHDQDNSMQSFTSRSNNINETLLATALVHVKASNGQFITCRALLDPGSQSNFIIEETARKLGTNLMHEKTNLYGINGAGSKSFNKTVITFKSRINKFEKSIQCLVVPNITSNLPMKSFESSSLNIPSNILLADPSFNISNKIEILFGGDVFWHLLCIGQIKLNDAHSPILHKTQLGWIIAGNISFNTSQLSSVACLNTLETLLTSFWHIESIDSKRSFTIEEQLCETHFKQNTTRNANGRFVVKIPFKENHPPLDDCYEHAYNRFISLEKRFKINQNLKQAYVAFMKEYEDLGHMKLIDRNNVSKHIREFYLPHHPVIREQSLTSKIRVVFDGTCESNKNIISLNAIQMTGPTVQSDLVSILLRFRKHKFVLIADIEKMYRQILVHPDDTPTQRILWRDDDSEKEIQCYELQTVTYGTKSAPYLATRCLNELADENEISFPIESNIIKNDIYVDDVVTGANSENDLINIKENLVQIFSSAGFNLHKFLSNCIHMTVSENDNQNRLLNLDHNISAKTLGLIWNAKNDTLQCSISSNSNILKQTVTKRHILSLTAQIFDPLGLFAPTVIIAKIIMQQLWQLNTSWDESVPINIHTQWTDLQNQFHLLSAIKIPRFIFTNNLKHFEVHGFADASEKAYGACIYLKSINRQDQVVVNLIISKSRVAPIKKVTLPRLELCAAVLLAKLMHNTITSLQLLGHEHEIYCWTDSTITLAWIKSDPNKWKVFVANRVTEIQNLTKINAWNHVDSKNNPADLISRGVLPVKMQELSLWWHGPLFLQFEKSKWNNNNHFNIEQVPESKSISFTCQIQNAEINHLFEKYSTFRKLRRVIAYCLRFANNCKIAKNNRNCGPLLPTEFNNSTATLVKLAQQQSFSKEYHLLIKNKQIKSNSILANLNLFLDNRGIIRVGGRLRNAPITFDQKHPMLLSHKHKLTELIAKDEHEKLLHCGAQEMLYSLRQRFWPTSGRNLTRNIIRQCIKCFRVNPSIGNQQMADLPIHRVSQNYPFDQCCTDYAGPINIRDRKGRNYKIHKAYICLFTCSVTKAIHLEAVTDLTSDCFIAALRRFCSRRGKPRDVYSDNGTNYTGANAKIKQFLQFINFETETLVQKAAELGINWHFIPARSPHFGGLWEAAVKSTKFHIKRVVGESLLTYEELHTLLTQIEAVLNSRPLTTLSSDANDPLPLSPAHFLIGRSLTNVPDVSLSHVPENRLDIHQRIQHMVQCFWKRWHKEYLNELQTRTKWKQVTDYKPEVGNIVLIKEENLPALRWPLGLIVDKHPGQDGIVRVLSIRMANGKIIKRALAKICLFPSSD